ncbi:hypothetical protein KKE14_02250 [Patescibacteria group bacterium]|nr:hypothetical protein [Patescibacteria group bacterium]
MDSRIITESITRAELRKIAEERFGDLVKAVVDIESRTMALGSELHADEEAALLEQGSKQNNLWGINLYPDILNDGWIEFDSMINVRPSLNNRSRSIEDETIRKKIVEIVNNLIK